MALTLVFGLMIPQIDNYGHMGGLLAGAAVAYAIGPRLKVTRNGPMGAPYYADCPLLQLPRFT